MGEWVESPIGVSPTAIHKLAHPGGEADTAKGTQIKCMYTIALYLICKVYYAIVLTVMACFLFDVPFLFSSLQ